MIVGEWTDEEMTLPSFFIKYKNRLPDHFYTQSIADRDEWVSILKQTIQNYEVRKSTLKCFFFFLFFSFLLIFMTCF